MQSPASLLAVCSSPAAASRAIQCTVPLLQCAQQPREATAADQQPALATTPNACLAAGIPALVVAAASFDDLVAITFYTIFASVSITGVGSNVGWSIAEGPVQLVFGVIGGLLAALLASWTKVWDTRWKRAGILFCMCRFLAPPV